MPPVAGKRKLTPDGASSNPEVKRAKGSISVGTSRNRTLPVVRNTSRIKSDPDGRRFRPGWRGSADGKTGNNNSSNENNVEEDSLRREFIALFRQTAYKTRGISNRELKSTFGEENYKGLVPVINDLMNKGRLNLSQGKVDGSDANELFYNLVSEDIASKFAGLDKSARMVYQVIEKSGNMGIWTKDVRTQTNIQQQPLTKIFKTLESRKLIKPFKSVTAKAKKRYILFDLKPAKELSGGPWYTEMEFDHEFISELRTFTMLCIKKMNGGKGVTLAEIAEKMKKANVSRVQLNLEEVQQLVQTLAYDYMIEQSGFNPNGEAMFIPARRVTPMCEFKWWDVLCPDFHFRTIKFEDGVTLSAHEPHHHTG